MVPKHAGRYLIFEEFAAGGMATVHFGKQPGDHGFARVVAIKRLHAHFAKDPAFVEMFLDEVRVAARVRHPNVVSTLDVVASEGELMLVMEYVHGTSLSRLIARAAKQGESVPLRVAVAIVHGALLGLDAAHRATDERGAPLALVHRDVSPQNVLVGVDGVARIVDFGVSKAQGNAQMTRDGCIKGKASYMAPEQALGLEVDRRADVFAAGVLLWELLTGRRLFKADTPVATMMLVVSSNVPAPSAINDAVPSALDALVLRAVARERSDRFATAGELAEAIEGACGLATTREVAAYVERLVAEDLAARRVAVARVESDPIGLSSAPLDPGALARDAGSIDATATSVDGARLVPDEPPRASTSRRGARVAALAVLATVLVGATGVALRRPRIATVAMGRPTASASAPGSEAAPPPAAPVVANTTVSDDAGVTVARATITPSAPGRAAARGRGPGAADRLAVPRDRPAMPAAKNCDPPYRLDDVGDKVPKPECF